MDELRFGAELDFCKDCDKPLRADEVHEVFDGTAQFEGEELPVFAGVCAECAHDRRN